MKKKALKSLIKENIVDWLKERSQHQEVDSGDMAYTEKAPVVEEKSALEDEIGEFYVVIKADKDHEMNDVVFKTNIFEFAQQIKGGLEKSEIHGIYKTEGKANRIGTKLMKDVQAKLKETYKKGQAKVKALESTIDELKGQIESKMQEAVSNPQMRESLQTESDSLLEKLTTLEAQVEKLKDAIDRENVRLEKKGDKKEKLASRGYKGDDKEDSKKEN